MKKNILFLSALFFLTACAKNEENIKANLKAQTLMYTQKNKINIMQNSAIVTMSYLNPVLDNTPKDENFVLSIAPDFDFKIKEITINGKKTSIDKIGKNDEILKYLISNDFTRYYKITSPLQKDNTLKVNICLENYPCFELSFQRYSKSLYYRSANIDTQYN